ncbi:MAG: deoxyguanosinetriphosphate triphosphohydrolase [Lachnospirales bacterium]
MEIRKTIEEKEEKNLSQYATKSKYSKGRAIASKECPIRTVFQRDRDRIMHSKSFRRLMHKTQVFISPEGDHYRTRLSHTLEVSQISRSLSRALMLNEDLTEAIALGHDLGHTPFGHTGESVLNKLLSCGFEHNEQSVRIVNTIEKLNLTQETIDGIKNHRGRFTPNTLEGKVVQISDKIAYVNHDIDDAIRANLIDFKDLPKDCINLLGESSSQRINFLITNIVKNSYNENHILLDDNVKEKFYKLRGFMYEKVYSSHILKQDRLKVAHMLKDIFNFYIDDFNKLPDEYIKMVQDGEEMELVVADFIAGMTDRFSIKHYNQLFLPLAWTKL